MFTPYDKDYFLKMLSSVLGLFKKPFTYCILVERKSFNLDLKSAQSMFIAF